MVRKTIKTTTLSAQVAISKMKETGLNHVQVLPDNPRVGLVEPFRGLGYGQMLSTGMFEFTRHRVPRSQAECLLRLPHSSISKCKDGTLRYTFIIQEGVKKDFSRWLHSESSIAAAYMSDNFKKY